MRIWAEIYPNAYIVGIFACCRQLYDPKAMSGLYDASKLLSVSCDSDLAIINKERTDRIEKQMK